MSILKPLHAPSRVLVTAAMLMALSDVSLVFAQAAPPAPAADAAASAASVAPAAAKKPVDLKVKITSLEEWDNAVDGLMNLTAVVYNSQTGQDLGGHDLEYYWQQHIMTAATKQKLETLRDQAQKQSVAKDTSGLQKTLDEASAILTTERAKASAISTFLNAQQPIIYHQYQLGPWLTHATDAERAAISDRVRAAYAQLSQELEEVLKVPEPEIPSVLAKRFYKHVAEPVAFFNAERERLVKAQAEMPSPIDVAAQTRGDKPCPAPVQPTKGRDKPSLAADFPSSESFYPAASRQNDVEGAVTVRAQISETGCIQRAEVAGTSGVARLDEAALDLAMAGKYVPAAGANGKPTAGTMMFRVKFEQPNAFD